MTEEAETRTALEQGAKEKSREKGTQETDRTKEYFEGIINSIKEGMMVIDRDYVITDVNTATLEMSKRTKEEVIGAYCYQISHNSDKRCEQPHGDCPVENVFDTGESSKTVHLHFDSTGNERFIEISASPITGGSGEVLRVVEVSRDITERIMLEEKLKEYSERLEQKVEERTAKLRESEKTHRTLIETMNDGLWAVDENGSTIFTNRKMEKILGYSKGEMLGRDILSFYDEKNQKKLKKELTKRPKGESSLYEIEVLTKTGEPVTVLIAGSPLFDEEDNPRGSFAVVTDITDRKRLERMVYQSEKLASLGQLAAGVAHEINNPLTNISLNTEILLKKVDDAQTREKLEEIGDQVSAAASIIRNLLDFSRQTEPEVKAIDINNVVAKTLNMLSFYLKDTDVTKDFSSTLPKIRADAGQLQQVFVNMIVNAVQAMPGGGKLRISTKLEDPHVIVEVSDTGHGISKEHLGKVFDPFFTTRDSKKGTGLGLSICYGIIEEHGGTIDVKSMPGKGTTFTVKLLAGDVNG